MYKSAESKNVVFLCDRQGKIKGIINDDIRLEQKRCLGQNISSVLSKDSFSKSIDFIETVREKKTALDFEMTARTLDGELTLFFSGVRLNRKILIIATNTYNVFTDLLEEMSRIINEQTNLIRSCVDDKAKIAKLERQRIEKDLHDSISQTIFSTRVIAEILPELLQKDQEEALRQVKKIKMLTTESLKEMRRVLLELRPDTFSEENLTELIQQLINAAKLRTNLDIQLKVLGSAEPKKEVKETAYRITQESLNNVIKHAEASKVTVLLKYLQDKLILEVEDNGRGFDSEKVEKNKYGLFIMRDRALSLSADLKITSKKNKGTKIKVEFLI